MSLHVWLSLQRGGTAQKERCNCVYSITAVKMLQYDYSIAQGDLKNNCFCRRISRKITFSQGIEIFAE